MSQRPSTAGTPADEPLFSMRQARSLLSDQDLRPKAWIYWTDLLLSWSGLMAGLLITQHTRLLAPLWCVGFAAAVILGYRCGLFIHELAHQSERELRGFRFAWHVLVGVPFLIPSFVYQTHLDHHRRRHYGTSLDGEYLPFGTRPVWHLIGYLAQSFVIPALVLLRFGVLTPLTWLGGGVRDWVHRHASSMIIDPKYARPLPSDAQLKTIRGGELACFLFLLVATPLVASGWFGVGPLDPYFLPRIYAVAVTVILLNAIRTLGAHRYVYDRHAEQDRPMSFTEQLLDSINFPHRPWLGVLWAPVGLRYHALHHLFPSLPYHAMDRVHARLMEGLPADSPYRQTVSPGLLHTLWDLWRRASTARQGSHETTSPLPGEPRGVSPGSAPPNDARRPDGKNTAA